MVVHSNLFYIVIDKFGVIVRLTLEPSQNSIASLAHESDASVVIKIWVTAIKDIKKGEEFTCDYGFGYDKDYKQFPCKCRSNNC